MIESIKLAIIASFVALPFYNKEISSRDLKCMADNLYYEARGEPLDGIVRVGLVTYNRMLKEDLSACKIVYQKIDGKPQFSWTTKKHRSRHLDRTQYELCVSLASMILSGDAEDISDGATHYDNVSPREARPWFRQALRSGKIKYLETVGNHSFYRQVD